MITAIQYIGLLIAGELVLHMLLFMLSKAIGKQNRDRITLKIAKRFKDEENKVSNDFFLMGNLISILFGIGYYHLLKS